MHFEGRTLKPYAEPVSANNLVVGSTYFILSFIDEDMVVPVLDTVNFLGASLGSDGLRRFRFQDSVSYRDSSNNTAEIAACPSEAPTITHFLECAEGELSGVFEFEHALDLLLACSIRRSGLMR